MPSRSAMLRRFVKLVIERLEDRVVPTDNGGGGNTAPTIGSLAFDNNDPYTNDVLVVDVVDAQDAENDPLMFEYKWRVNGQLVHTTTTSNPTDSLDLSQEGFGNVGDNLEVSVIAMDAEFASTPVSTPATVRNSSPAFPAGPQNWKIGELLPKDAWVGRVQATDADNDSLVYSITGGNTNSRFAIDNLGWITVASNMQANDPSAYELAVQARDPSGATANIVVQLNLVPLVVVTGDFHAVEGDVDTIRLEFVRIAKDYAGPLDITFQVTWGSADRADLQNPSDLIAAGQITRTVHLDGCEIRFALPDLGAFEDIGPEGIEDFRVEVIAPPSGEYTTLFSGNKIELVDHKPGFMGSKYVDASIFDGITLFAQGVGDAHEVSLNDILQGTVGDCFFMAAIGAWAKKDPDFVRNTVFTENVENGTVTVTFYQDGQAVPITVDMTLDFGWTQAKPTGDTDSNGNYEVWPIIWEKAYRQWLGWDNLNAGGGPNGFAAGVWTRINNVAAEIRDNADYNEAQYLNLVIDAYSLGKKIVFGSYGDNKMMSNGTEIIGGHAYVVTNVDECAQLVTLYNPWGGDEPTFVIPFSEIKRCIKRICIQ